MPSKYSKLMQEILDSMFEGFVLDENKKLKVVNEAAAKATADKIHKLVLEKSRDLWQQFESAENELRNAAAEINFEELNADVSSMGEQVGVGEVSLKDLTNMEGAQTLESKDLKTVLGTDDFDLSSVFESLDHLDKDESSDGDRRLTDEGEGEGMMLDAEDEELDGDDEFTKLQVGGDEEGMGGDAGEGDMEPDEYGNGEEEDDLGLGGDDEIEIEPENGEEPMDDLGMDDELNGEEPMGAEGDLDFDFDSLGDLEGEDEMEEMMGGYRMESEGEDDDKDDDDKEDKDDDDKDDDKDDDDKDDDKDDDDKPAFLKDKDED